MYKLTTEGKTIVGCNEDAWRTTPHIWFENADTNTSYGAAFTGSRVIGENLYAPQSGMNTEGLAFSRLASYHPGDSNYTRGKKQLISDPDIFLKEILHNCSTVAQAKVYWQKYDHSIYTNDVLIYVDKSGDYLIVEPYTLITGNDPTFILSNFCPSITTSEQAHKLERYHRGETKVNIGFESSLEYCTALSDTMHVCRTKQGDGTLLTSIWDTQEGLVNLYFYHDYTTTVQFRIRDELAKGDRTTPITSLFAPNEEFRKLVAYITPFNTPVLRGALAVLGVFFFFSSFVFILSFALKRKTDSFNFGKIMVSIMSFLLFGYMYLLATTQTIFYFDTLLQYPSGGIMNLSSYIPLLLLVLVVPILYYTITIHRKKSWSTWIRILYTANSISYVLVLLLCMYWGLFFTPN